MHYDFDLLVIGAGSGGIRAARLAAGMGAKVAVVESRDLGGTCVNVGCVPKKLFVYAAEYSQAFVDAAGYGHHFAAKPTFDWHTLRDNKTHEIKRLNGIYQSMLEAAGVQIIRGQGAFVSPHQVRVGEETYAAKTILIATGSWPAVPDIAGAEHLLTSNDFFYLARVPQRAVILGGGYIAVEFAGILQGLGVETHLVYRGDRLLKNFDDEISQFAAEQIAASGVRIHYRDNLAAISKVGDRYRVSLEQGGEMTADAVISAIGRTPLIDTLALDKAGVKPSARGHLSVNDFYQTNVNHIYAVGDVIGGPQLTPLALAEGSWVAHHLFAKPLPKLDYSLIPTAVFCQPNIASVGLTEAQAVQTYQQVAVYLSRFTPMKNQLAGNAGKTLMKLLVDVASDKIIGCHMVGPDAAEIIQGLAVAMRAGATKGAFDATLGIHPTAAEEFVTMRTAARIVNVADLTNT